MITSNPTTAKPETTAIQDLPKSRDIRALTPDEEKNVMGGATDVGVGNPPQGPNRKYIQ